MAIGTGAAILGSALLGGATSIIGGDRAADAAQRGANAATAESARQYDQTRADLSSGRSLYEGANSLLGQLYGIPITNSQQFQQQQDVLVGDTSLPAGTTTTGGENGWYDVLFNGQRIGYLRPGGPNGRFINDTGADINALRSQSRQANATPTPTGPSMSSFFASPDYQSRRDEGNRGIERSAAARGGAFSGNALRALTEFNSNLASGEFGNFFNRLTTMAGLGSAATDRTAAYGAEHAANAGRNALYAGDARASGIMTGFQGANNAAQGGLQNWLLYDYMRKQPKPVG